MTHTNVHMPSNLLCFALLTNFSSAVAFVPHAWHLQFIALGGMHEPERCDDVQLVSLLACAGSVAVHTRAVSLPCRPGFPVYAADQISQPNEIARGAPVHQHGDCWPCSAGAEPSRDH